MISDSENNWFDTPLGRHIITREEQLYAKHVVDLFGFNALQLGMLEMDLLKQSRIPHLCHVEAKKGDVLSESEYLPFAEDSVDLVCLPHLLEFCDDPHQTLREVERILVPEGHVILTGFSLFRTWWMRRHFSRSHEYPWCGRTLSIKRIKDWLALLGLEYVEGGRDVFVLPINEEKWIQRQQGLAGKLKQYCPMVGNIYYIVAKKRVVNMTPLKPKWKKPLIRPNIVVPHTKTKSLKDEE